MRLEQLRLKNRMSLMRERHLSRPVLFFFLALPYGISGGLASRTLPLVLTKADFSVALSASIVAIGISANIWSFLWGPVADLTFTLRRWYAVGLSASAATLLAVSVMPLRPEAAGLLTVLVFLSQVASTLVSVPVGALMAHTVAEEEKGRACGWSQAGNLGGTGLGGGLGVWLASHFSFQTAGLVLFAVMAASAVSLYFVPDVRGWRSESLGRKMRLMGRDLREMLVSPPALLAMALVSSPIGVCAAGNIWPAIAPQWGATPDAVALFTGLLSGFVSAAGCVCGGWIADRTGPWQAFFGTGVFSAAVAFAMAGAPRTLTVYCAGVLVYALSNGLAWAAYSALVLHAIGRGAASTKYAALSSLGNLPLAYMTALNGWVHDRSGAEAMLVTEAGLGIVCVLLGLWALGKIRTSSPAHDTAAAGRET